MRVIKRLRFAERCMQWFLICCSLWKATDDKCSHEFHSFRAEEVYHITGRVLIFLWANISSTLVLQCPVIKLKVFKTNWIVSKTSSIFVQLDVLIITFKYFCLLNSFFRNFIQHLFTYILCKNLLQMHFAANLIHAHVKIKYCCNFKQIIFLQFYRIGEAQLVDVTTTGQIDRSGEEEDDGLYCACRSPFTSPLLPATSNVSLAFLEHESSKHIFFLAKNNRLLPFYILIFCYFSNCYNLLLHFIVKLLRLCCIFF